MVKMYKCSNLFGIVGSKNNKDFKQKELIIWDDKNNKDIYKFKFKKDILNLELTEDSIVVVCEKSIYVFNIEDFQLVDVIRTGPNPKGLVAINRDKRKVIVYPSVEGSKGKLTIKNYDLNKYLFLNPMEKKEFEYFTLSWGGILLATLEKESKKIRIYETQEGGCLSDLLEITAKIPKEVEKNKDKKNNIRKYLSISKNEKVAFFFYIKYQIDIFSLKDSISKLGIILRLKNPQYASKAKNMMSNCHKKKILGLFGENKDTAFIKSELKELSEFEYKSIEIDDKNKLLFIITSNGKLYAYEIIYGEKNTSYLKLDQAISLFIN